MGSHSSQGRGACDIAPTSLSVAAQDPSLFWSKRGQKQEQSVCGKCRRQDAEAKRRSLWLWIRALSPGGPGGLPVRVVRWGGRALPSMGRPPVRASAQSGRMPSLSGAMCTGRSFRPISDVKPCPSELSLLLTAYPTPPRKCFSLFPFPFTTYSL